MYIGREKRSETRTVLQIMLRCIWTKIDGEDTPFGRQDIEVSKNFAGAIQ